MSEIQVKRFSWIDFHRFPLSMDKNHLIAKGPKDFIDFDFYLLATPGCNYTQNYSDVILKGRHADLNCKKGPNTSHHKKILNLIFKKR